MAAKVVFFFGQGKWGWTETYYWSASSTTLAQAQAAAITLAASRSQLLGLGATLEAIRISDTTGKARPILDTTGVWNSTPGSIGSFVSSPWTALLIGISAGNPNTTTYKRSIMLRGVSAEESTWNSLQPTNPTLMPRIKNKLTAFLRILGATSSSGNPSAWCIQGNQRDTTENPKIPVTVIEVETLTNRFIVGLAGVPAVGFKQGTQIVVSGSKGEGTKGLNGRAYIAAISGVNYTLTSVQRCPNETVEFKGNVQAQAVVPTYAPIYAGNFERYVSRDTGRAFFVTRGRRSSPRC